MTTGLPAVADNELLQLLERAFARHAGADARIDADELQKALGLRSLYLARRVLAAFDRDGNGTIERDEFLQAVRRLLFGDARDKLSFAFRIHDSDGDGFIDPTEMLRMISIGMAESEIAERVTQPAEYLTPAWAAYSFRRPTLIGMVVYPSTSSCRPCNRVHSFSGR